MENMKSMVAKFIYFEEYKQPETGEKIPTNRKLKYWYDIIADNVYGKKYSKKEKLLACEFLKRAIEGA